MLRRNLGSRHSDSGQPTRTKRGPGRKGQRRSQYHDPRASGAVRHLPISVFCGLLRFMAEQPAGGAAASPSSPSILNDILGPVMRGPSSSHTAGSYHIGKLCASLLGSRPARARVTFDGDGSYGQVYRQQGVDRAFACALLGWPLTDSRFFCALESAGGEGLDTGVRRRAVGRARSSKRRRCRAVRSRGR